MSDQDDATKLAEISRELPPVDLDTRSAERIAQLARRDVGRGLSSMRFVEPVLVAIFTTSFLVWALVKVLEAYR